MVTRWMTIGVVIDRLTFFHRRYWADSVNKGKQVFEKAKLVTFFFC